MDAVYLLATLALCGLTVLMVWGLARLEPRREEQT